MSLCEFDEDDGQHTFRCAKQAEYRINVKSDWQANPPYELLYCADHADWYRNGAPVEGLPPARKAELIFTVTELPHAYAVLDDSSGDGGDG